MFLVKGNAGFISSTIGLMSLGLQGFSLGHFQVGSYRYRSLIEGLYTLIEPLYTLNSPPEFPLVQGLE